MFTEKKIKISSSRTRPRVWEESWGCFKFHFSVGQLQPRDKGERFRPLHTASYLKQKKSTCVCKTNFRSPTDHTIDTEQQILPSEIARQYFQKITDCPHTLLIYEWLNPNLYNLPLITNFRITASFNGIVLKAVHQLPWEGEKND